MLVSNQLAEIKTSDPVMTRNSVPCAQDGHSLVASQRKRQKVRPAHVCVATSVAACVLLTRHRRPGAKRR